LRVVLLQVAERVDDRVVEDALGGHVRGVRAGDVVGRERLRDRRAVLVDRRVLLRRDDARGAHRRGPGGAGDDVLDERVFRQQLLGDVLGRGGGRERQGPGQCGGGRRGTEGGADETGRISGHGALTPGAKREAWRRPPNEGRARTQ